MPQQQQQPWAPPEPGNEPRQEGARWRFHRPDSSAVADWFRTQPLDKDMQHDHYVGGVVLISQNEKVKYTRPTDGRQFERHEVVYTPYMQIGTRVAYFRRLAEERGLIPVSRPLEVPRTSNPQSAYFNVNMTEGLWWHVVETEHGRSRYLCATWRVALYERESYMQLLQSRGKGEDWRPLPVLEGTGTKQVPGSADLNQIAKAQTGALGRALGVAGILVIGTGIATAEDMAEYTGQTVEAPAPVLPPTEVPEGEAPAPRSDEERLAQLRSDVMAGQARMQEETPEAWQEFAAWWSERARAEDWKHLSDVPLDLLPGIIERMAQLYRNAKDRSQAPPESNEPTESEA